jgi:hypothetical protein
VAREQADAVICTGDLTMRGTSREFDAAADYLAALAAPVSVEPGNHDMPYYWELATRLRHPFRRFEAMRGRVHGEVAVPGWCWCRCPRWCRRNGGSTGRKAACARRCWRARCDSWKARAG